MEDLCHLVLCQPVKITEIDDHLLLFRQPGDSLAKGDPFDHPLLFPLSGEHVLQRKAVVASLPLDGLGGGCRRLCNGDLFRREAELGGNFTDGRFPMQRSCQAVPDRL